MPRPGRLAALETLRLKDFRYLWMSNGATFTGQQLANMGMAWLVLELTDSVLWVGVNNGIPAVPIVLFSLLGGVLADRLDRRQLMIQTRLGLAGLAFVTAFLVTSGAVVVWHLVLLTVVAGCLNALSRPASQTFVFDIVGRDRLISAISLNTAISNVGSIVGPAAGGVLIAAFDVDTVFYLMGEVYLAASFVLLLITTRRRAASGPRRTMFSDLIAGLECISRTTHVKLLLLLAILVLFAEMYFPLATVYARDVLDVGARGYGYLLGAYGVGSLTGSVLIAVLGRITPVSRVIVIDSIVFGTGMIIFAFSRSIYLSLACAYFMGITAMVWTIAMTTVLQTSVDEDMRGRVMSMFSITMQVVPLGWLLGGAVATVLRSSGLS